MLITWVQKFFLVTITGIDQEVDSNLEHRNVFQNAPIYKVKNRENKHNMH